MNHQYIDDQTLRITGRGCDCYLLLGDEEAIMIDSGCAHEDIRAYAQTLTPLPVHKVINTHSHFDHTGGNGYFDEVYMTKKASYSAKNYMDEEKCRYRYDYDILEIEEGFFPFKGRDLQILVCDVHSPGNIMILDTTKRILFTGDEIDHDQVLLLPGFAQSQGQFHACNAATVSQYQNMLKRIWTYEKEFNILCTGHNGSPLDTSYITDMIALCDQILAGKKGISDLASATYGPDDTHYPYADAHYLRYTSGRVSLIYCDDDLQDSNKNSTRVPATPLHAMCADNFE